jgi:hypothetical protein
MISSFKPHANNRLARPFRSHHFASDLAIQDNHHSASSFKASFVPLQSRVPAKEKSRLLHFRSACNDKIWIKQNNSHWCRSKVFQERFKEIINLSQSYLQTVQIEQQNNVVWGAASLMQDGSPAPFDGGSELNGIWKKGWRHTTTS